MTTLVLSFFIFRIISCPKQAWRQPLWAPGKICVVGPPCLHPKRKYDPTQKIREYDLPVTSMQATKAPKRYLRLPKGPKGTRMSPQGNKHGPPMEQAWAPKGTQGPQQIPFLDLATLD